MLICWSDDYITGIKSIDEQHQSLVDAVNNLYTVATASSPDMQQVSDSLFELLECAMNHFIAEEELFQRYNYPQYQVHKAGNDAFNLKAQSMIQELGPSNTLAGETLQYLKDWLHQHILSGDKDYVTFLKDKGVE